MKNTLHLLNTQETCLMEAVNYKKEAELQQLIASNPDLIKRDTDPDDLHLFLIQREVTLQSGEKTKQYSMDHLFVDSDGVPVLVEVKLCRNYEIHSKVVGQLLNYATHIGTLDMDIVHRALSSDNTDIEEDMNEEAKKELIRKFQENIAVAHMKIVFVVDKMPRDLEDTILFLDKTSSDIEYYGVELEKYIYGDTTLISRTVYSNSLPVLGKAPSENQIFTWDEKSLAKRAKDIAGEEGCQVAIRILHKCEERRFPIRWGTGPKYASFAPILNSIAFFRLSTIVKVVRIDFDPSAMQRCLSGKMEAAAIQSRLLSLGRNLAKSEKDIILDIRDLNNKAAMEDFLQFIDEAADLAIKK